MRQQVNKFQTNLSERASTNLEWISSDNILVVHQIFDTGKFFLVLKKNEKHPNLEVCSKQYKNQKVMRETEIKKN